MSRRLNQLCIEIKFFHKKAISGLPYDDKRKGSLKTLFGVDALIGGLPAATAARIAARFYARAKEASSKETSIFNIQQYRIAKTTKACAIPKINVFQ